MPISAADLATLTWRLEPMRPLARELRRILRSIPNLDDDRAADVRAQLHVNESLGALLKRAPSLATTALDVALVKNLLRTVAAAHDQEAAEYLEALLSTITEPAHSYASLRCKVRENIESFSVSPFEDPDHPDGYSAAISLQEALTNGAEIGSVAGRRVSVTGDFVFGTRDAVIGRLEDLGARWIEEPGNGADLLVLGTCAALDDGTLFLSSKLRQALAGGVPVAHESHLLTILL